MEPIYRSDGEWVAVFCEGQLFNVDGEWLGFIVGRELYDPVGRYIGFLSNDRRLLRTRREPGDVPRKVAPPRPQRPSLPSQMPLAPMLPSLPYGLIDLFEEFPARLIYISATRPDKD